MASLHNIHDFIYIENMRDFQITIGSLVTKKEQSFEMCKQVFHEGPFSIQLSAKSFLIVTESLSFQAAFISRILIPYTCRAIMGFYHKCRCKSDPVSDPDKWSTFT